MFMFPSQFTDHPSTPVKTSAGCDKTPSQTLKIHHRQDVRERLGQQKCEAGRGNRSSLLWCCLTAFAGQRFERCEADTLISFLLTCHNFSTVAHIYFPHVWKEDDYANGVYRKRQQLNERKAVRDFPNVWIICTSLKAQHMHVCFYLCTF